MRRLAGSRTFVACVLLVALVATVFSPLRHAGFQNFDDDVYVGDFQRIHHGLTPDNVRWAFTTVYFANWHPLTWLSYMIDCQLFGVRPDAMHVENVLLHAASAVVLLLLLRSSTGRFWPSAVVAALFALHPMHVESVAWIAERKDVLSTFFLLLAWWAYVAHARRPSLGRYALVLIAYVLSLLSKSMGVTFPVLMILWDLWPLQRAGSITSTRAAWRPLLIEKLPLLAMAAVVSAAASYAQHATGSLPGLTALPLSRRLANAAIAYVQYLRKLFVPTRLAPFYPFPEALPPMAVAASIALLILITVFAWRTRRRWPFLIVGWLWFVIALLPVIGVVQVGGQAMADRYSYLPSIGLFVAVVWWLAALATQRRAWRVPIGLTAVTVIVLFAVLAWIQAGYWQDSVRLFSHALDVTDDNAFDRYRLGVAYRNRGDYANAAAQFYRTVELNPSDIHAYNELGSCLYMTNPAAALGCYQRAVEINPDDFSSQYNLATALLATGQFDDAAVHYRRALQIDPASAAARAGLARAESHG